MKFSKSFFIQIISLAILFLLMTCNKDEIEIDPDRDVCKRCRINSPTVWRDKYSEPEKADYIIDESLVVAAALSLEPGVVIAFREGGRMSVTCKGSLNAIGTSSQHITIRGDQPYEGFWEGIFINSSPGSKNKLKYCDILHAGRRRSTRDEASSIALDYTPAAPFWSACIPHLEITNCIIKDALGYGLIALKSSFIDAFGKNEFSVNGPAALLTDFTNLSKLDTNSILESTNGVGVEIQSEFEYVKTDIKMRKLRKNAAYLMSGKVVFDSNPSEEMKNLEISKGVEIRLADNASLSVLTSISAIGTAAEPITFTGTDSFGSQWSRILITSDNRNKLEYCEIKYGGATPYLDSIQANIFIRKRNLEPIDSSSLVINNCIIGESGGCGIYVYEGALLIENNNTYINNEGEDICE